MKIKSIVAQDANTVGNHACKVQVLVEIPVKDFNKLCPIIRKPASPYSKARTVRDLGNLVLDVNNAVYNHNKNIPAYFPSIDPKGEKRAFNGIKTLEFNYFVESVEVAEKLGMECHSFKDFKKVKAFQTINLLK